MADMRRFLDLTGLGIYDEKIKTVISTGDAQALADAKKYFDDNKGLFESAGSVKAAKEALQAAIDAVDAKVTAIKDGTTIDSFADVEAALAGKQNTGDYATKAEAQAMADGKDAAIQAAADAASAADAKAIAAQGEVDALETLVGALPEGTTATSIVDYVNKKTEGIATDAALGELNSQVAGLQTAVQGISADYLKGTDKTELEGKITAAETAADTAVAGEKSRAEGIEAGLRTDINTVMSDYLKASDKTELQNNINTVSSAVELLTNGVDAGKVDGVNDLIKYVEEHGSEVTGMQEDIAENAEAISGVDGRVTTLEGQMTTVQGAVATKAEQETVDGIGQRVTTAEGKVATLEGKMTTAEGNITTLQGEMTQAQTDIAALQEKFGDGENSVSDMIADAVAVETSARETAVAGVQENVDTLAEAVATKAAQSEVNTISGKVGTLETKVGTLETEMDAVEAAVDTKATSADLTALTGRVTTAEGKITTLEGEMDAVEGRLDDAEDAIEGKANQTTVDGIATRLGTAETNIAANTAAIAKFTEITSAEINALFNA